MQFASDDDTNAGLLGSEGRGRSPSRAQAAGGTQGGAAESIEAAALHQRKKEDRKGQVHTARSVLGGQFLPMVSDKVGNNVKNRWALMAAYANATALVLVVAILLLYAPKELPDTLTFSVPPPRVIDLGVPMPSFSVRLVDGYKAPIPGRTMLLSMSVMSPIDRTVEVSDTETVVARTVNCVDTMIDGAEVFRTEDFGLCAPQFQPQWLANRTATTDGDGVANFDKATLGIGVPKGNYLFVVSAMHAAHQAEPLAVHAYATSVAQVRSMKQVAPVKQSEAVLHYREKFSFSVDIEIAVASDVVPTLATAQLITGNFLTPNGVKGIGPTLSISSGKRHTGPDRAVVSGPGGGAGSAIAVAGPGDFSNQTTSQSNFWSFRLDFVDMVVQGTNTRELFFSISFWGRAIPVLFLPTNSPWMYPTQIWFPVSCLWTGSSGGSMPSMTSGGSMPSFALTPQVPLLTLHRANDPEATPLQPYDRVVEGEELVLMIQVISPSTGGLDNQVPFFLDVLPSRALPSQFTDFGVSGAPASRPKQYGSRDLDDPNSFTGTNSQGFGNFTFFFSYAGNIGLYDLTVSVDGSDAPWSGVYDAQYPDHANPRSHHLNLTLNVTSSVTEWLIKTHDAPWAPAYETVGEPWGSLPSVQVFRPLNVSHLYDPPSAMTTTPLLALPGKTMRIALADASSEEAAVYVESQPGDSDGWINPVTIRVLYATQERTYTFNLYVDDQLMGTFTREVRWPAQNPHVCVPTFESAPTRTYTGTKLMSVLRVRDVYGNPVSQATTTTTIDTGDAVPFTVDNTTGVNGLSLFRDRPMGFTTFSFIQVTLHCRTSQTTEKTRVESGRMILPLIPRFKGLTSANYSNGIVSLAIDAHWDQVSAENPLQFTPSLVWLPRYIAQWYPKIPVSYEQTSPVGQVTSEQVVQFTQRGSTPGLFILSITVDSANFGIDPRIPLPNFVKSLRLRRSCFGHNSTFTVDQAVSVPPRVEVTMHASAPSGQHVVLFTQLGYLAPGATSYIWIWPRETQSQYGLVQPSVHKTTSFGTNGAGERLEVVQMAVKIGGLRGEGYRYKLRYCGVVDLKVFDGTKGEFIGEAESTCVEETETFTIDLFSNPYPKRLFLSPKALTVSPGTYLPVFNVSATDSRYRPVVATWVLNPAITDSQRAEGAKIKCDMRQASVSWARGVHTVGGKACFISATTPQGQYTLYAEGSGTKSNAMIIFVTDSVATLELNVGAFPQGANFSLGSVLPVTVDATTITGDPTPNQPIELEVHYTGPLACQPPNGCGSLSSVSRRTGITDAKGHAVLPLSFSAGATGVFEMTAKVASGQSDAALQQATFSGLTRVCNNFGVPISDAPELVPLLSGTVKILLRLAKMPLPQPSTDDVMGGSAATTVMAQLETLTLDTALSEARPLATRAKTAGTDLVTSAITDSGTTTFQLQNPVHNITILEHNLASFTKTVSINALLNVTFNQTLGPTTLRVQLLDVEGNPVPNTRVSFHPSSPKLVVTAPRGEDQLAVSDSNGIVNMDGLNLDFTGPGEFDLTLSAAGGGIVVIERAIVYTVIRIGTSELMQYIAYVLVAVYSPLLLATVPHSRTIYSILGLVLTIGVVIFTMSYAVYFYDGADTIVRTYLVFGSCVCCLMALINVVGIGIDLIAKMKKSLAFMNDEARASNIVRYVTWLVNVRIETQMKEKEEKRIEKRRKELDGKVSAVKRARAVRDAAVSRANRTMGVELTELELTVAQRKKKATERPPLDTPKDLDVLTPIPVYYLIVVAISFVLVFTVSIFMVWLLNYSKQKMHELLNYLPNPTEDANVQEANDAMMDSLQTILPMLVRLDPSYAYLNNVMGPLSTVDVVGTLVLLREFIEACLPQMDLAFGLGIALGCVVTILTAIFTALSVKETIIATRRGKGDLAVLGGCINMDPYIGLHCFHFVFCFLMMCGLVIILTLLLGVESIGTYLYDQLIVVLVASIGGILLETFLKYVFVGCFLTDGFTITRPEMFALWHYFGLILGAFTGLVKSISRWITSIVVGCAMFALLNVSIYPEPLIWLDLAHLGFRAVVVAEAKNGNPLYLLFVAMLLKERHLRNVAEEAVRDGEPRGGGGSTPTGSTPTANALLLLPSEQRTAAAADDAVLATVDTDTMHVHLGSHSTCDIGRFGLSPAILNVARVLARKEASAENSLDLWEEAQEPKLHLKASVYHPDIRQKKERLANRWWLLWILHLNPSLCRLRKHSLYHEKVAKEQLGDDEEEEAVFTEAEEDSL